MITSHDIANKKFDRAGFGGYKNDDVDGFLNEIAVTLESLESQNDVLTKKLEILAEKLEEYRNDEESLRTALLGAQKLGDSVIRESKNKAEIIMRDATIKAERIIHTAHEQVEKEKMVYLKLKKDVASFKNKLLAIYKQHLEIISNLPEEEGGEAAEQPAPRAEQEPQTERPEPVRPSLRIHAQTQEENRPEPREPGPERNDEPEEPRDMAPPVERDDYEEPNPPKKPHKFIPVPPRLEPQSTEKSGKFDEYYEDAEEEAPAQEHQTKRSKFGTLKFGAGYDLKRE